MFTFLGKHDRHAVGRILADLQRPVSLLLFTAADDGYGDAVCELLRELTGQAPRLQLEVHDTLADLTLALRLELCGLPVTLVGHAASGAANIRFYGLPSGYTFVALLEALLLVGAGAASPLQASTLAALARLRRLTRLQIFVSADSPACPATVVLANAFAHASPALLVETIEVRAFPELARGHQIAQTPTIVIDRRAVIPGPIDEAALLAHIHMALGDTDGAPPAMLQ